MFESADGFSPTVGIIGAVLGLIQVMQQLDKIDEVGRGIAVAFVATIYGARAMACGLNCWAHRAMRNFAPWRAMTLLRGAPRIGG